MFEILLADGQAAQPVMMFPVRETAYDTTKYGKLDLNRKMAEEMIANFKAGVLGTKPFIDKEHAEGEAAGWVQDLYLSAPTAEVASKTGATEALYAKVEWNGLGQKLLTDKSYQYISPWWGDFKDPADGKVHHNVFMGAALCNNPVLRMMPAIELSDRKLSEVLASTDATMEIELAELKCFDPNQPRGADGKWGSSGADGGGGGRSTERDTLEVQDAYARMNAAQANAHSLGQSEQARQDYLHQYSQSIKDWNAAKEEAANGGGHMNGDKGFTPSKEFINQAYIGGHSSGMRDAINAKSFTPPLQKDGLGHTDLDRALLDGYQKGYTDYAPGGSRMMSEINLAEYDWDQCMIDMTDKYGDEATAKKVCGKIRSDNGADSGKKLSDVLPEVEKQLSVSPKQKTPINGGGKNMDLKAMAKILGLPDTATAEEIQAEWGKQKGSKMSETKLADNPEYKKLQEKVEAQNTQLAEMQRKDLERQTSEIVSKEIPGGYKLSAPSQKIISEILLSESPTGFKLSEKDPDSKETKEVTVSLADAIEHLVDNLALVKMGETTRQKHDKGGREDPEKKLSDLIAEKRKGDKDLGYREASTRVLSENPDLAVALAG